MPESPRWRVALGAATTLVALACAVSARAQGGPAVEGGATGPGAARPTELQIASQNSGLDAPLFYQLLIGEIELRQGEPGNAFEVILDAARRTRDDALFKRAVEIALQNRAGEQALSATQAWRLARPESPDALRLQLQILLALNRVGDIGDPLKSLLMYTPAAERAGLITALPRFLQRSNDTRRVASTIEEALQPYLDDPATRLSSLVAVGRAWLYAGDHERAHGLAQQAHAAELAAPGPALLALELMPLRPDAERIVKDQIAQPGADHAMRLAYTRALTTQQRYAEAVAQLELVTREQPDDPGPYLTLGALQLEVKQPRRSEAALLRYIELVQRAAPGAGGGAPTARDTPPSRSEDDEDDGPPGADRGLVQAWLLLAQAAEQRADYKAAEDWLARIDDPQRALEVQSRRASILLRQGKLAQARALLRNAPERSPEDARAKLVAEAALLRDAKRWGEAFDVLAGAAQRFADDADLLYEQAMMAEKLNRLPEMERLLRQAIALKPDNPHAHNALGYSLADRGIRLDEARVLIQRALELAPGDPFIVDSMGWLEFRAGNIEEALRLLRRAYAARPDTEIGAHLGEALWAAGQRDEARRIWREVSGRDQSNELLRNTLARLRIAL